MERDTFQTRSTTSESKGMIITKNLELFERRRTNGDNIYDIFEKLPSEREELWWVWHGPILCGKVLVFFDNATMVCGQIFKLWKYVKANTVWLLSESSRRIRTVHRTGSLCSLQASQMVNCWDTQTRSDSATAVTSLAQSIMVEHMRKQLCQTWEWLCQAHRKDLTQCGGEIQFFW